MKQIRRFTTRSAKTLNIQRWNERVVEHRRTFEMEVTADDFKSNTARGDGLSFLWKMAQRKFGRRMVVDVEAEKIVLVDWLSSKYRVPVVVAWRTAPASVSYRPPYRRPRNWLRKRAA